MPTTAFGAAQIWVYRYLAERDGEKCVSCPEIGSLVIDHIDGDRRNHNLNNLRLLCRRHNYLESVSARPFPLEREREEIDPNGLPATEAIKNRIDFQTGSTEMQVNDFFETHFRNWVKAKVRSEGEIDKKDAINAGAEEVGANPSTTRKYLDKLISSKGPLKEIKNSDRRKVIRFKSSSNEPYDRAEGMM